MGPVVAGMEADRRGGGGRYGAFGRHEGRRGRLLDVLVEWEGENSDGDLWDRTWRSHGSAGHVAYRNDRMFGSYLSADLRADARKLLAEGLYLGPRPGWRVPAASVGGPNGQRSEPNGSRMDGGPNHGPERQPNGHRSESEATTVAGSARLRDRAPAAPDLGRRHTMTHETHRSNRSSVTAVRGAQAQRACERQGSSLDHVARCRWALGDIFDD